MLTIRFNYEEKIRFEDLWKSSGLTKSDFVKKRIFEDNLHSNINKEILMNLGGITTAVNELKFLAEDECELKLISNIERCVKDIWQIL